MQFKTVQTNGYKISEVDLFLRKLNKWQADGKTKTVSTKLQRITFSLTIKQGYDPKEVDDYLDSFLSQKTPSQKSVSNPRMETELLNGSSTYCNSNYYQPKTKRTLATSS